MKAFLRRLCRWSSWTLVVLVAWALVVGFAWEYATNAYIIERLEECLAEAEGQVQQARAEREDLEREALAVQSDPFYAEVLLRERLRWVRGNEVPLRALRVPSPAQVASRPAASPLMGGTNEALFISPSRRPGFAAFVAAGSPPEPRL